MPKRILLIGHFWMLLSFLALPISYRFLPNFGSWISAWIFPLNAWICETFWKVDVSTTFLISDSAAFYATSIVLLLVAILVGLILKNKNFLGYTHIALTSILAYFLLRYGCDKIIGNQFYFPAPNTLFTPVGSLSKDILYWSTMGTSATYNYFMATTEIIAGSLLLWNRTRFLGVLFSVGILANIFATNVGFDITVKYLSGLLLSTSIFLLFQYPNQLKQLVGIETMEEEKATIPPTKWKPMIKTIILLFIALEVLFPNGLEQKNYPFQAQTFEVLELKGTSKMLEFTCLKRIHFHREGYLVTESHGQEFKSYPITSVPNGFRFDNVNFMFNQHQNCISWNENGQLLQLRIKEIDLKKLPLSEDGSHWCVEEMIGK